MESTIEFAAAVRPCTPERLVFSIELSLVSDDSTEFLFAVKYATDIQLRVRGFLGTGQVREFVEALDSQLRTDAGQATLKDYDHAVDIVIASTPRRPSTIQFEARYDLFGLFDRDLDDPVTVNAKDIPISRETIQRLYEAFNKWHLMVS